MQAIRVPLSRFPILMTCYENGCISFDRTQNFATIVDQREDGLQCIISNEDMYIGANTVVNYGEITEYKEMPELLVWLQSLNLEMPIIHKGF
jgi:hypothetical protein